MKVLYILKDSEEIQFPFSKEKILIGRDESCDVKLEGSSISRKHAILKNQFDKIYIENLSSSGSIFLDGKPVEYVELEENEEIKIGSYGLVWKNESTQQVSISDTSPQDEADQNPEESEEQEAAEDASFSSIEEAVSEIKFDQDFSSDDSKALVQNASFEIQEQENSIASESQIFSEFDELSQNKTVWAEEQAIALLKIRKGEEIGREIRLEHGHEWIVGRAQNCQIVVENGKLSRQHFKIIKIGKGFRIQDLGSSNGSRLNGVSISDAPLQVFDTIKAGPVEFQFIIIDKNNKAEYSSVQSNDQIGMEADGEANALMVLKKSASDSYEKIDLGDEFSNKESIKSAHKFAQNKKIQAALKKIQSSKAYIWWEKQPKKKKVIYSSSGALMLLMLLLSIPSENNQPIAQKNLESQKADDILNNAADPKEVSSDYNLKSPDEKRKIAKLYQNADKARRRGDWQTAFDSATQILEMVDKYKDTHDILSEAHVYITEKQIATLSENKSELESAEDASSRKVRELLDVGAKALKENRWEDAQESFIKAMNLDPQNKKASVGQVAATAQDASLYLEDIDQTEIIPADPYEEMKKEEAQKVARLNKIYNDAKQKIQEGAFRQAFPLLGTLKNKLEEKISEYEQSGRMPASALIGLKGDLKSLRGKTIEALDVANDQYVMEYKSQLDDAQRAVSNKRFIEARSIYDNIIKKEPHFEEPKTELQKLYKTMVTQARSVYQEGLIYESVGDVENAIESFEKTQKLLNNVREKRAQEYYSKATARLSNLKR